MSKGGSKMKINEGSLDRTLRVIAGLILLALGLLHVISGVWVWVAVIFGAILLVTGLIGFCPLYTLLKINTARK
jgi:hypothetical protein